MIPKRLLDSTLAQILRFFPNPFGRYRYRYRFYQHVKNSDLVLLGRIRHSGLKIPLNLGDWVQYWMFMDGAYERELIDFLCPRVRDGIFFDVGANVGSYTLTLARSARQTYSFEASPSNALTLDKFLKTSDLSNVDIINKAVSDVSGEEIRLYTSPDTGGNHTQFHNFGKGFETATTITLDQFAQERGINRIDVIKMDIEGSELRAFQGARKILSASRPLLLVEFNALVATQAGWRSSDLYDLLCQYDYKTYELRRRKLTVFDATRLSDPNFYANLFFIHEP